MVTTAASVEWTVVSTEVEALQLEYSWIKEFDPRFNVKYRDDKSYPWLAVTLGEEFPRAQVMRGAKRKGTRYFGPYAHAWAIRETLDLLLRVFPMRTCTTGVFKRAGQVGRPCLLGYIDKCSAPCVGRVTAEEHRAIVEDFCDFMAGNTDRVRASASSGEMHAASAELEFEQAARLRDDLGALSRALEKQAVVLGDGTDADVVALAEDQLEVAVQVFHVRGGRVRGQRGWVADKVEDVDTARARRALPPAGVRRRVRATGVPREVLVPALPPDAGGGREWLGERCGAQGRPAGAAARRQADAAGDRRTATPSRPWRCTSCAGPATSPPAARRCRSSQEALGLAEAPLRDRVLRHLPPAGHRGGRVDGRVRGRPGPQERVPPVRRSGASTEQDDVAAMHEVHHPPVPPLPRGARRGRRARAVDETPDERPRADRPGHRQAEASSPTRPAGRRRRRAAAGRPRPSAALDELGIDDIAVCGLAKRLEEVWLPGQDDPVILPRTSEGLYLLQRVRDEAHRFAITFHRQRRSKAMTSRASWTTSRGWARPGARRCCGTSAR